MLRLDRSMLPGFAVALITLLFGVICAAFVHQRGLATFADDSVSYLVMAQVFSPWQAASPPVAAAFPREAFYPPLLPLLLALAGAAHDIARAQVLQALLLAACLPLVYVLAQRWLQSRWTAVGAVALVASVPALWIQAKGVLSEPLFCLLLLALYWICDRHPVPPWKVALALAGLVLTRTMGLALAAAYALWALTRFGQPLRERLRAAAPAVAAALAYGVWVLLRPAATADDNVRLLMERSQSAGAGLELAASVARQVQAIAEGWVGSLMLFWVEGQPLRVILAGAVGVLALAGLALRAIEGRADAWISAAYLCVFLAWPFHEQMVRFLLPLMPILILYALDACARIARRFGRPPALAHLVLGVLLLTLTGPALAFIHLRARAGVPHAGITDWYRTPDLKQARARAQVHLDLMADMDLIRKQTRAEDRVMWVVPSYLALLADRRGVRAPPASLPPDEYRAQVRRAAPDYVFLSRYHPRDTLSDRAWQAGLNALSGRCKVIHARTLPDGTTVNTMLLQCQPSDPRGG
jgi:hypothetical protein